jgi:3-oxoadipate enol-lactonase
MFPGQPAALQQDLDVRSGGSIMAGETLYVESGAARLRVVLDGPLTAPPLMFSNSLGAALEMWDAQVAHFAPHRRIIRYDVRGHGESTCPPAPYAIADLARDALRILDHLGYHMVDWVGCSMGGMTGMHLLTHHRERFGKAVLGNTSARMGPPDTDWDARIANARANGMASVADAMKLRWFTAGFNETNPAEVNRVTDMVRAAALEGYIGCACAIRDMDQRESIKGITNPVLVLIGTQDPATPPAHGELMAQAIPGAQTAYVPAAHISNCEAPEAYNAAVSRFLME